MRARVAEGYHERLERTALNPLAQASKGYYAFVLFLLAIVAWGLYAYVIQLRYGLLATGMRDVVIWGLYLVNFVFFIGISHAGTLISAILRVTHAGWRTPITRMAELITVVAISIGALMPIIDLGRPERVLNMLWFGRFQSPLLWDIISIVSYLTGSLIYLYLPLIPDLALMRDRLSQGASTLKRKVYTFLAVGWRDTPQQRQRLEKAIGIMAITIIPIAVSVHTVVSYVFSMTLRPGWDSTIFGIYFVIGAIFSGIASSILIVMAIFRKLYHLEEYITERHFRNLSYLLLTSLFIYLYLTIGEYLTVGYKLEVEEKHLLESLMLGKNALGFWFFVVAGVVVPGILLILRRGPTIPRVVTAILVNVAMWVKRFVIIIPSLQVPLMPFEFGAYTPTWVEWSITAGAFAAFILIFAPFAKLLPVLSIWEVAEETEPAMSQAGEVERER